MLIGTIKSENQKDSFITSFYRLIKFKRGFVITVSFKSIIEINEKFFCTCKILFEIIFSDLSSILYSLALTSIFFMTSPTSMVIISLVEESAKPAPIRFCSI